jgi:hypothetical protein
VGGAWRVPTPRAGRRKTAAAPPPTPARAPPPRQDDFVKAARKVADAKKLEGTISYDSAFGDGKG